MRKIIVSIAAAGMLVTGAFVASAVTGSEASAQTDEAPAVTDEVRRPHGGAALDEVLADLVADGTLDQSQADAVKDALVAKHDEMKEKFGDRRDRRNEIKEAIEGWLEDGAITPDEIEAFDGDLPMFENGPLADALDDGRITQAEWEAIAEQRETNREAHKTFRENLEGWLEDGVISAEELATLGVDLPTHEDGPLAEALEDGQITQAEWDEIVEQHKANRGARRGAPTDSLTG